MKALSVQQPWAWALLYAGKTVENRTWPTEYRGSLLIHAGKKYDRDGHKWIEANAAIVVPKDLPRGGIVGRARVVGCVKDCPSIWFSGPYGFLLSERDPLPLFPWPGKLGLFDFPDELLPRLGVAR